MKNKVGQTTKIILRIIFIEQTLKEEIENLLMFNDYVYNTILFSAKYLLPIFKNKGYLDINKEEDERRILSMCNFLIPLNFNQKYNDEDIFDSIEKKNYRKRI